MSPIALYRVYALVDKEIIESFPQDWQDNWANMLVKRGERSWLNYHTFMARYCIAKQLGKYCWTSTWGMDFGDVWKQLCHYDVCTQGFRFYLFVSCLLMSHIDVHPWCQYPHDKLCDLWNMISIGWFYKHGNQTFSAFKMQIFCVHIDKIYIVWPL